MAILPHLLSYDPGMHLHKAAPHHRNQEIVHYHNIFFVSSVYTCPIVGGPQVTITTILQTFCDEFHWSAGTVWAGRHLPTQY